MNFDKIMNKITSGLTGDKKTDIVYLQKQIEKYKNHKMSKEITRACGRLIFQLIPEKNKEELTQFISNNKESIDSTLEEISFNVYKKDYQKALLMAEALVSKIEKLNMFQNDEVSEYYSFNEPFEEILFDYKYKPKRDIRHAQLSFVEIYLQYGSLLFEMQQYDKAQTVLEKALRWNPVCTKTLFEYMETFKVKGNLEEFANLTRKTFKVAFVPADLARCYRNMGYYFVEKEVWECAMGCYMLSLQYDSKSPNAQSELYYINGKTNGAVKEPSMEELKVLFEQYELPLGPDEDVLGLSVAYGQKFLEQNEKDAAKYFLSIAYELTKIKSLKDILETL